MISVALFNNKGGVGKTTLTYHLAHMLQRLGHRVLAVDLDPQSNLTAAFLDDEALEDVWQESNGASGAEEADQGAPTVAAAVKPIMEGMGDILPCRAVTIAEGLWLVAGDLTLSSFEDRLSEAWPKGFTGDPAALRTTTAFHRIIQAAAREVDADIVLIDVGPNLGAINRAALLAADTVLVPLAADLFSLRGLRNLGPTLRAWRRTWHYKVMPDLPSGIDAPAGLMHPLGYVIMQPTMRLDRPVRAYQRWLDRIPQVFASAVLDEPNAPPTGRPSEIATLRNYQSLMPLAHDARKPMFDLRSADGALGSTQTLVQRCFQDFQSLSEKLLKRLEGLPAHTS
ncbi:ParA family protein [Micromonospora sp. NPDC005252]|uniref:ParA family protein n=1 Tax=Micromonospora sp. NPDC005252 TaxID=3364228 RepID=UPI00367B6542